MSLINKRQKVYRFAASLALSVMAVGLYASDSPWWLWLLAFLVYPFAYASGLSAQKTVARYHGAGLGSQAKVGESGIRPGTFRFGDLYDNGEGKVLNADGEHVLTIDYERGQIREIPNGQSVA